MKRLVIIPLVLFLLITPHLFSSALADGGGFAKRQGRIFYLTENTQYAIIGYKNGIQRMVVSVSFAWENSEEAVWIFPLPANPAETQIDIIDGLPEVAGTNIKATAREEVSKQFSVYLLFYTVPFPCSFSVILFYSVRPFFGGGPRGGIEVYKHLEKEGLTVELVSAKESGSLYTYLSEKGFNITREVAPQLENYISKGYSFALSWLSATTKPTRQPGIVLEFPTEKIYFPLALTSIYGSARIPIRILVMNHVIPELYPEIKGYSTVTYWAYGNRGVFMHPYSKDVQNFTRKITEDWDGRFTAIELNAPATAFKEDLWMKYGQPWDVRYAEHLMKPSILIPLIFCVLLSYITALIIYVVRRKNKKKDKIYPYLFIGSVHIIFGWVGVLAAIFLLRRGIMYIVYEEGLDYTVLALYLPIFLALFCGSFGLVFLPLI